MTITLTVPFGTPGPPGGLLTVEEFDKLYSGRTVELVKGVVKELPMPGFRNGKICLRLGRLLNNFLDVNPMGRTAGSDAFVLTKRNPDTVRGMDMCFISFARLPEDEDPVGTLVNIPELIAEVRSPSDAWADVFTTVEEYMARGVIVVLVIDPDSRTVSEIRAGQQQTMYHAGDTMKFDDILPGFALPVDALFR